MIFKDCFLSQRKDSVSITKIHGLLLLPDIFAFNSESRSRHTHSGKKCCVHNNNITSECVFVKFSI